MFSFFNVEVIELGMFVYCCILELKKAPTPMRVTFILCSDAYQEILYQSNILQTFILLKISNKIHLYGTYRLHIAKKQYFISVKNSRLLDFLFLQQFALKYGMV